MLFQQISPSGQPESGDRQTITFGPGEELRYKVHYGFVNAATARMVIADEVQFVNGKPCYKIDVFGESTGMFDVFLRIRDNWGTFMDTTSVMPQRAYRHIEEGKYRKHEIIDFDHRDQEAHVKVFSNSKQKWKPVEKFSIPDRVQDLVSGYYYLRTIDFKSKKNGDIIKLNAFFDKEVYDFSIKIVGREEVKTKLGVIRAIVLSPIMPENSLFDGENSVRVWISDDINKVPLKIKANMFVGAVEVDIESFSKGKVK
jgi:hypothetical protein